MFGNDRTALRQVFVEAWRKYQSRLPLEPLEALVADVVAAHPEYHALLTNAELDQEYTPERGETNPFLHMALHVSLREQLTSDRPPGIAAVIRRLARQKGDLHQAEHLLLECLGRVLWEAQRNNRLPDEAAYLECARKWLRSTSA